jgi:SAM-dependent methyltransferase
MKIGPFHLIKDETWRAVESREDLADRALQDERAARLRLESRNAELETRYAELEARVARQPTRADIAGWFLRGDGLEIGALHDPLPVPPGARVRYVDRIPVEEMRRHYPELGDLKLVSPDILTDGETLTGVPDASADFIIANHFLEHCEDPVGALAAMTRVVRPGGVLYISVPDKRTTFDSGRETTTLEHIARDHVEGPAVSRDAHYREFAIHANRCPDEAAVQAKIAEWKRTGYSIHFHAWTPAAFAEFLSALRPRFGVPAELEFFRTEQRENHEILSVLRRVP